ncbi:TonB-dependent receptor [Massilia sp. CCM 8733]|uniref:TonB-dependent receptor n=1 Tax=Massilia mucilaginosa TaxID=2609282 RepID=A0ABX0NSW0_9BURK|nr:TonB-dependent receptor [Massilia mucilaginosa]NHZ89861.1 TonB-dependent receptor [Massilia mucilaginosa]
MKQHGIARAPKALRLSILAMSIASLSVPAMAQSSDAGASAEAAPPAVVVTGTRVSNRSVLDTASAVDVVSADLINNNGVTEVSQALSAALPALNFPRPGLTDGTDTVRPVTLRGLAPDQALVLVNSKRRHASALVNVNGTVGRGSASADLNTIPAGIIQTVEVLRDGAAAQYGSDAIAGVINLRLRENRSGGEFSASTGARITEYDYNTGTVPAGLALDVPNKRKRTDGQTTTVSGWKGFTLGEDGFLTVAAEYKKQSHTERSAYDVRQQYPLINGKFDPREQTIQRYNTWGGEPELTQTTLFANAAIALTGNATVYGSASYQKRDASAAGFFRRPLQDENIVTVYPDGYLPVIAPTVDDVSATGGLAWSAQGWDFDASLGFGRNKMAFTVDNSLNRSLGATSKTEFDAGGFAYDQLTLNFSAVKPLSVAILPAPLNVAVGAEARRENYELWAGEADSYRYGGVLLPDGRPSAAGSQVFPGYTPANAIDSGRHSIGAFLDLETKLTPELLTSLAVRAERYSDFGSNVTGKLATRYDFTPSFGLRGSLQNGFRAPSPQQQFYTSTAMTFIDGAAFNIATFRPNDPVAVALGAKPLEAEKSANVALGAVARIGAVSLTVDAYRIKIRDRIVLSENLTQANVRQFLAASGYAGVGGSRFFINGVDSTTTGVDVVANWPLRSTAGVIDLTLAGNFNTTEVTRVPVTAQLAALNPAPSLFGRANVLGIEEGQPKNKISASARWKLAQWGATFNATRYGKVLSAGSTQATDFWLTPKTVVNLEARYTLAGGATLALGADNLFDAYSDPLPASLNTTAAVPYANRAPFGRSGRFVYARASYKF